MGWLPFRILFLAKLTEQVFVRSTWTRGQDLAGQARRSHSRTCSVHSQRNSGNQFPILEQLTLLVALYIHDTVVQKGELISGTWSRNIATKNIPPLVTDQSSDKFPSQQERKNVDKGRMKKGFGSWVLSGSRRINVQTGIFVWCHTDNHVRIVAVTCTNAVGSMSWLRALGCTMMMVKERLLPSRLSLLDSLQTRVRKKYQEELPTLKMLMCAKEKEVIHSATCSHRNIKEFKIEQAYE